MAVTRRTLALIESMREWANHLVDDVTRDLVGAWVGAWDAHADDLAEALTALIATAGEDGIIPAGTIPRHPAVAAFLTEARDQLDQLAAGLVRRTDHDLDALVVGTMTRQADVVESQLPPGRPVAEAAIGRGGQHAVAAITRRTREQITARSWELAPEATEAMRTELAAGVVAGRNPREAAARMVSRVEGRFNGGLTRALVIARTEMLDAHRAAAKAATLDGPDSETLVGWRWMATLDTRTCPACLAKHGERFPLTMDGPQGHQQCRCTRVPVTASWDDLGLGDLGLDEPDDEFPDARAWFDQLPENDQLAVMGPRRLALLRDGTAAWEDLATLRRTPEWRDSWHPTPVSALTP